MFNSIVRDTKQHLETFNIDLCKTELFEIELFDHFAVFKRISNIE